MTLCLTRSELVALTGYKQRPKQIEALTIMDIDFRVNPLGHQTQSETARVYRIGPEDVEV